MGQAHVLFMDVPGVGKTDLVRALSFAIGARSTFLSGEPTMDPREIVGGEIYVHASGKFLEIKGPLFTNIFLFDEINRAPPKAEAPLLQAMEERIGVITKTDIEAGVMQKVSHPIYPVPESDELFFILLATANPIEQEGTYPLSEAILERFSISFSIGFPARAEEKKIRFGNVRNAEIENIAGLKEIIEIARHIVDSVELSNDADEYIMRLIENSRPGSSNTEFRTGDLGKDVDQYIEAGVSPRSNLHFEAVARTKAFLSGRNYISVDDIKFVAPLVMAHRIRLLPYARVDKLTAKDMIQKILRFTKVPP